MDDTRIKELTEEVLQALYQPERSQGGASGGPTGTLEARVALLEARLRQLHGAPGDAQGACATAPAITAISIASPHSAATTIVNAPTTSHPALHLLGVTGSTDGRCVLDADKPCVGSGACRTYGH